MADCASDDYGCAPIRALCFRLRRDYKRVHEDVETLTASGLLQWKNGGVSAPYDAITAEMRLE